LRGADDEERKGQKECDFFHKESTGHRHKKSDDDPASELKSIAHTNLIIATWHRIA